MDRNKNDWYASEEQAKAYAETGSPQQRNEALASITETEQDQPVFTNEFEPAESSGDEVEFAAEITPDDSEETSPQFTEEVTSVAAEEEDIDPAFIEEITSEDRQEADQDIPEELKPLAEAENNAPEFAEEITPGESEPFGMAEFAPNEQREDETEFAAEVAAPQMRANAAPPETIREDGEGRRVLSHAEGEESITANRGVGLFALVLAIASLFVWPAVLGPAAVVLGFVAWGRGNTGLGIWSIAIGLLSFLAYAIFLPMLY